MELNRKLNLVIPVETQPGVTVYVHSTPLSREVFETYYRVIAKAFTDMYAGGFNYVSGPRIAKMLLKQAAEEFNQWNGPKGVNAGLIGEIHRITNVLTPGPKGWAMLPFEDALNKGLFDEDDVSEVENAICFFILVSAMHKKKDLKPILETPISIWGAQLEYLSCTEFSASLPTSTSAVNTGEKAIASPIPI